MANIFVEREASLRKHREMTEDEMIKGRFG